MYDTHIHSTISFDGYESIDAMCAAAVQAGLHGICFCEHVEMGHIYPTDWNGKIDWALYTRQMNEAREKYPQLVISKGVEVGLSPGGLDNTSAYIDSLELDFVIASQHQADGRDPYSDRGYYEGRSAKDAIMEFLLETHRCLQGFQNYDVIGHLTFASLFAPQPQPLEYGDYPDILDAILKTALSRGKGIEINTTGYYIYDAPMATLSVARRFRELGGEVVTIGSDAHFSSAVGFKYREAVALLKAAGFSSICTFAGRKPVFHKV